jgi:four helix bundle protein
MAKRFEDLAAWRFCTELCERVEQLTDGVKDQEFRGQIRDAAESAPALIAEGFVRFTTGEMIRYLRMARAGRSSERRQERSSQQVVFSQ